MCEPDSFLSQVQGIDLLNDTCAGYVVHPSEKLVGF